MAVFFSFSYTVSARRLECITSAYPNAVEGSVSPRLQSSIITNGQLFTSRNSDESFYYDWNYTPQVHYSISSTKLIS